MMRILTMVALVLVQLSTTAAEPTCMRVPLKFDVLDNISAGGGLIRLRQEYSQNGNQPIVLEAEKATHLELQTSQERIISDINASGGYYIKNVKYMRFDFIVESPGLYQAYFRSWFPLKASYSHNERMDDGEVNNIVDSMFADPEAWLWTKAGSYELARGKHVYEFPAPGAFCGGARLDSIALIPLGRPKPGGLGPDASPIISALNGNARTKRISLRQIKSWSLKYEVLEHGGKVTIEHSYDNHQWTFAPHSVSQSVPSHKPRFLYFRISVTGAPGQATPCIIGLELNVSRE